jgi:hypothetical protein
MHCVIAFPHLGHIVICTMKQRWWLALVLWSAACGGHGAKPDAPVQADARVTPDAPVDTHAACATDDDCANGFVCDAPECVDVAGALSGLLWQLPCDPPNANDGAACGASAQSASAMLAGAAGTTYDVTVRIRGVVEDRTYPNGCKDGYLGTGGTDGGTGDPYNVYKLSISSPPQTYYINSGTSYVTLVHALDYTFTFRADAGATVTLSADPIEGHEIYNHDSAGMPVQVADSAGLGVTQPYDGQFAQLDVTAIVPDPVASDATIGSGSAGSALSFTAGTYVRVADAGSLQPASGFTLEGWFASDDANGSYQTVLGRTTGSGTDNAYSVWYAGGYLHAGQSNITHPTTPWTIVAQQWHHVAVTADAAAQRLYIDGMLAACAGGVTPAYDAHPVLLGADIENGALDGFWHGTLDELRIFSSTRTGDQVWADMHTHELGAAAGLVGEWTFDEGTGQTTNDTSGTSNTGQLGATTGVEASDPVWVTSTVPH